MHACIDTDTHTHTHTHTPPPGLGIHLASRGYLHAWGDTGRKREGMGGLVHPTAMAARMMLETSHVLDEPGPEVPQFSLGLVPSTLVQI